MNDKQLPSLASLNARSRAQTPAQKASAVRLIAAQFGLKERPRKARRGR